MVYRRATVRAAGCLLMCAVILAGVTARAGEGPDALAVLTLEQSGVTQGLCLVVGAHEEKLVAALAAESGLYVQACTRDSKSVQAGRAALEAAGVADRASILWREVDHLPYADDLVNLLVVPRWGSELLTAAEVVRVLAPGGTAIVGADAGAVAKLRAGLKKVGVEKCEELPRKGWLKFVKPVNLGLGVWTHIKGGADQSYVSADRVVGPWKEIRWFGGPRWGSLYISYGALVTAAGRIYYKESRQAPTGAQWHLVARDAYNGFELWRINSGPTWLKTYYLIDYRLTCDESRVYVVEGRTLLARDGRTGKEVRQYLPGFVPRAVTASGDFLLASTRGRMAALDKTSGAVLWNRTCGSHPAADGVTAYVASALDIEAIEMATGKPRWKTKIHGLPAKVSQAFTVTVMYKADLVYVVAAEKYKKIGLLAAFDAKTGSPLWKRDGKWTHGVLPFDDEVWCMDRNNKNKKDNMAALVLDSRTGEQKRKFQANGSVMGKCWRARATANHILYGNGWYLDRKSGVARGQTDSRSPCQLGQHPANGLTYFMPHHCDCGVTLRGFLALSKPGKREWFPADRKARTAPLFRTSIMAVPANDQPDDWPVYRKDIRRSNAVTSTLPERLRKLWSEKVGTGRLTQPTVAYGRIFVAERQTHRVSARDAANGKELWSFIADGTIEYSPTLHKGLCLFGTGGGSVYALDAASGKEIWRLRAAPAQKYIGDRNQFGSPWPVIGGVMMFKGVAHFGVGRSRAQPGGLWLFAVDPATGGIKWRIRAGSSGDMFTSDGTALIHTAKGYSPKDGSKVWPWKASALRGVLRTTRYLGTVSIADYMACVEPRLSYKKHIELTDGRIKGEALAFNDKVSVAAWRYTPGVPDWKKKENTNKYFLHAAGAVKWNVHDIKQQMVAMVLAGDRAYAAGVPTSRDPKGKGELWVISMADGKKLQAIPLAAWPVYDGLSASSGRLYLATMDGRLTAFGK